MADDTEEMDVCFEWSPDGRKVGDWETKYKGTPGELIRSQKIWLFWVFAVYVGLFLLTWLVSNYFNTVGENASGFFSKDRVGILTRYTYAGVGGGFGGLLYIIHLFIGSVNKGWWHQDRELWWQFTPLFSAGLGFIVIVLIDGGFFTQAAFEGTRGSAYVIGIAFFAGFFSNTFLGKLKAIADAIFGDYRLKPEKTPQIGEPPQPLKPKNKVNTTTTKDSEEQTEGDSP